MPADIIGKQVRKIRLDAGLSQAKLAKLAEVCIHTIWAIEGAHQAVSTRTLENILTALGYVMIIQKIGAEDELDNICSDSRDLRFDYD